MNDEGSIKTYNSSGYMPSFKDHNNETNIDRCYKKGKCFYQIKISLRIENNKKTLYLSAVESKLVIAEEVIIEQFNLFYLDGVIHFKPKQPVSIKKAGDAVEVAIDEEQTEDPVFDLQPNLAT